MYISRICLLERGRMISVYQDTQIFDYYFVLIYFSGPDCRYLVSDQHHCRFIGGRF